MQALGYTDAEIKKAINLARPKYKTGALIGVDEEGFIDAVRENLRNISR